jgi:hypothetical protein
MKAEPDAAGVMLLLAANNLTCLVIGVLIAYALR